ncbi:hypothetical protein [Flavobacterium aquatile]|uniref:DUF4252 domain-containing protein n=1 Tax=Flavobacterium aquatile LMG 4008 = ATCC 11947 TaxID=1453498 RepID=A0A095V088_9FLAO|nr:hypothetical protein [Flavobacterium aquatile]KGD68245.1 hypothetical protein LG45_08105 [Flavobacterium aquatile LMG 4008 = ATCC 11947]OXA68820.1 hypothetical protein B0A61_03695 [Flavobacterium aquatile LMG 4008 = ATCC 11947]GEC77280.1 hypothetical protein FAQ01_01500 [Flavobacterium aquatile]
MIKNLFVIAIITLFLITQKALAQGKLAADFKTIIGKTYTSENQIEALKNYKYEQGIVIGNPNEGPFLSSIEVFRKGKTAVVLLSKKIKTNPDQYRIIDVLKVISIPKNYEIRTYDCSRKNGKSNENIVAIVFSGSKRIVKFVKNAYVLKDIRFEKIETKGIRCINEGIE